MSEWASGDKGTVSLMNQKTFYVGTGAPAVAYDGQPWVDTSTNPPVLKIYDTTNTAWMTHHPVYYETQTGAWANPSTTPVSNGTLVVLYNSTQAGTRLYAYSNSGWVNLATTPTAPASIYGDGSDGVVTIAAPATLTRDYDYSTLTVNNGITLDTAGYTVRVSGTLTNQGTITDAQTGGAGGSGGAGGDGATEQPGAPGAAGSASSTQPNKSGNGGQAGGGGGAGALDGASKTGGNGGDGSKGGGYVRIYASTLNNTGTIHADGTAGVTGANGVDGAELGAKPGSGAGGGGSGGDGGTVELYYGTLTSLGTVRANGGAAGSGGTGGVAGYAAADVNRSGQSGGNPNGGAAGDASGDPGSNGVAGGANGGGGGGGLDADGAGYAGHGGDGGDGSAGSTGTTINELM